MSKSSNKNNKRSISLRDGSSLSHKDLESMLIAVNGTINGMDTDDNEFTSILSLWNSQLKPPTNLKSNSNSITTAEQKASELVWYNKAFQYWESEENCPISDDGVLGGYGKVTPMDTRDSNVFLDRLIAQRPGFECGYVADCGAGIGRVTKNLLLPRCSHIDLIEQSPRLLQAAPQYLESGSSEKLNHNKLSYINIGLQDFTPIEGTYDLIWIQWVIGHLHDLDVISFFRRCANGLKPNGVIVLKDNSLLDDELTFLWDLSDSSVARHIQYMKLLLSLAGLQVILEMKQTDFPTELLPVMMFAIAASPNMIGNTANNGQETIEEYQQQHVFSKASKSTMNYNNISKD